MADNSEAINGKKRLMFLPDECKMFHDLKIHKRKRSPVEYVNCAPGDHRYQDSAAPRATDDDPEAKMSSSSAKTADDPLADIDPEAKMSSAAANGNNPDAEIANANGNDPDAEMANANGNDPDAEMANGDDPEAEIPPAAEEGSEEMTAEMREHIIGRMGGYRVQMIIEKVLTATDMRTDQGRLMLPPKQLRVKFLTEEEEASLQHRDGNGGGEVENGLNYMDTWIVGPDLIECPIRFKMWLIGSRFAGCMMNKWNSFAKTYGLKAGKKVRVWSFRVDERDNENSVVNSELRFALVELTDEEDYHEP